MKHAILITVLLLAGCVSAKTFPTGSGMSYPPTTKESILVFFSAEDVRRPYEVVAEIMTEGSSGWGKKDSDLTTKGQKEAAKVGAHAIIITKEKGSRVLTAQLFGSSDKVQRIQAIRFTEYSVRAIGR